MSYLTSLGRSFIAVALIAFGIQHLIYLDFITRIFPAFPLWIPMHSVLAVLLGVFLIATGLAIFTGKMARTMCLVLGGIILLTLILFLLPQLLSALHNPMLWTNSGKALVLAGATFLVAMSFPKDNQHNAIINGLEKIASIGKYTLAYFFILAAIMHFMYAEFVATLVPNWIPAHLFWTYFAAVALIVGAVGMLIPRTAFVAALLSAAMVFSWVIILHIPRALADLHNANETTAAFEATAMCGMALLIAANARRKNNQ